MARVSIIGGGNVAHALAAMFAREDTVTVITRRPNLWNNQLLFSLDGKLFKTSRLIYATSSMSYVSESRIIVVALPQFAVESVLSELVRHVMSRSTIIFIPAPAKISQYARMFVKDVGVVGLQRVPFVARIAEYGKLVKISGCRAVHRIAFSESVDVDAISALIKNLAGGQVETMSSLLALSFSNSNALLHPSRLCVLFKEWRNRTYCHNPLFYGEWTDASSELYVSADMEMRRVMQHFSELNLETDYESVFDHYEVSSAHELTEKLRSIPSLNKLSSPMIKRGNEWYPDFDSRYFTEDVPYGTMAIQRCARDVSAETPTIDRMIAEIESIVMESVHGDAYI